MRVLAASAAALFALALPQSGQAADRIVSLDSCADQYVLALAPREAIVGVSHRADDPDSWMRKEAGGLPQLRVTHEALLGARPSLVVAAWGGDARLDRRLTENGAQIVRLSYATGFADIEANIRRVAEATGRPGRGEALIAGMRRDLAAARHAHAGRPALYLTPSGFTAGPGTLIDAILSAAGLTNLARTEGFAPVSVEQIILRPPAAVVLGFFDAAFTDRRGAGRHPSVRRRTRGRVVADLPASILACPAWMSASAARQIAEGQPG